MYVSRDEGGSRGREGMGGERGGAAAGRVLVKGGKERGVSGRCDAVGRGSELRVSLAPSPSARERVCDSRGTFFLERRAV